MRALNAAFKNHCDFRFAAAAASFRPAATPASFQGTVSAQRHICPPRSIQSLPFEAPDSPGVWTEVCPLFPAAPPPCLLMVPCPPEPTSS